MGSSKSPNLKPTWFKILIIFALYPILSSALPIPNNPVGDSMSSSLDNNDIFFPQNPVRDFTNIFNKAWEFGYKFGSGVSRGFTPEPIPEQKTIIDDSYLNDEKEDFIQNIQIPQSEEILRGEPIPSREALNPEDFIYFNVQNNKLGSPNAFETDQDQDQADQFQEELSQEEFEPEKEYLEPIGPVPIISMTHSTPAQYDLGIGNNFNDYINLMNNQMNQNQEDSSIEINHNQNEDYANSRTGGGVGSFQEFVQFFHFPTLFPQERVIIQGDQYITDPEVPFPSQSTTTKYGSTTQKDEDQNNPIDPEIDPIFYDVTAAVQQKEEQTKSSKCIWDLYSLWLLGLSLVIFCQTLLLISFFFELDRIRIKFNCNNKPLKNVNVGIEKY